MAQRACRARVGDRILAANGDATDTAAEVDGGVTRARSNLAAGLDAVNSFLFLRHRRLGAEIRMLGRALEETAFPSLKADGEEEVILLVRPEEEGGLTLMAGDAARPECCMNLSDLPRFLDREGIQRVRVDTELESNQVADVLGMLWQVRHLTADRAGRRRDRLLERDKVHEALCSDEGLHMSCANVRLDTDSGTLFVRNSYCQLLFSRMVTAYKKRKSRFRDHRAFFRAAPRYALLATLVILMPVLISLVSPLPAQAITGSIVAVALLVGFGTYMVFQTIASEEYDKEHQARELEQRHAALSRVYEKLRLDLRTARTIQRTLLPETDRQPLPGKLVFAPSFVPEMEVGGDYYDYKRLDDDRVAILLADVAGHGMAAAFVTGLIKTSFEVAQLGRMSPAEFLTELNQLLERLTPPDSFAAVVFAVYDSKRRALSLANAGHTPVPIVVRARTGEVEARREPVGLLCGVEADTEYETAETSLEPHDKLVLCTDGIVDSVNPDGSRFGIERFQNLLRAHAQLPARRLRDFIVDAVAAHVADAAQSDDETFVIVEVEP